MFTLGLAYFCWFGNCVNMILCFVYGFSFLVFQLTQSIEWLLRLGLAPITGLWLLGHFSSPSRSGPWILQNDPQSPRPEWNSNNTHQMARLLS